MNNLSLWLGLQADSDAVIRYQMGRITAAAPAPADMPPLPYQQMGNVACVRVQGALVQGYVEPWIGQIFGVTGYDNVREAAIGAATNPDIQGIVYNYSTTGGDAAGVEDLSNLLLKLRPAKPSCSFTDSYMCSSGYWMGSSADHIISTNTAMVGSIGVKLLLMSRAKMLADAGIETKVIRYGDNKALGGPTEPITKAVVDHYTQLAATMGVIFEQAVADNLGMTLQAVQKTFGQGSEFLGVDAVKLGMVNEIGSFETAMAYVRSSGSNSPRVSMPIKGSMMKTELVIPPADDKTVTDLKAAGTKIDGLTTELATATAKIAELTAGTAALTLAQTTQQAELATLNTTLETSKLALQAAQGETAAVKLQLETATTSLNSTVTQRDALTAVVLEAAKSMAIALNTTCAADTAEAALAEHARLSAAYSAKFRTADGKVSGVPSTPAPAPAAQANGPSNLFFLATAASAVQ